MMEAMEEELRLQLEPVFESDMFKAAWKQKY